MLLKIIAYLLIVCQLDLVLCRPGPQNQHFNGSNPYYDRYNNQYNNQYWGDNSFSNVNTYSTTQKSLYPSLYPQAQPTPPPYYGQGQYNPTPQTSSSTNRNSSIQIPYNTFGGNNSYGWNNNVHTTSPSYQPYQPYGQRDTTTPKPPITTLPPFYQGTFNRYNSTFPSSRPQTTFPSSRPQTTFPSNPPQSIGFGYGQRNNNMNFTNNFNNTSGNRNWNTNTTSGQYPYYHQNTGSLHPSPVIGQGTKNNNFFNHTNSTNNYNYPSYRPSAPPSMPQGSIFDSKPTYDQNGTPLAPFQSFHSNIPINDNLFNYDNLLRRRPNNGIESGSYDSSNVPLAPFPNSRAQTYGLDSNPSAPLAPFPGRG